MKFLAQFLFINIVLCSLTLSVRPAGADVGTVYLDDVSVPTRGLITGGFTPFGDGYAFGSDEEDHGGLWFTDGTTLGTWQIHEDEVAATKVAAGPNLFYWVDTALFRTNGTPTQRTLIQEDAGEAPDHEDYRLGAIGNSAYWLKPVRSTWELWQSDGREGDARLVVSLARGGAPNVAGLMRSDDSRLVFLAPDQDSRTTALWLVDASGEVQLLDTGVLATERPFFCAGQIYYTKRDEGQIRLFRSNGSVGNAARLSSDLDLRNPSDFLVDGSTVYFQATLPTLGAELWRISGVGGAELVVDLQAGSGSSLPQALALFQDAIWTMARVGNRTALWQVPLNDPTAAARIEGLSEEIDDHVIREATVVGNVVFLVSSPTAASTERWLTRTDGTAANTEVLDDGWLTEQATVDAGWPSVVPIREAILFASLRRTIGVEPHAWNTTEDEPSLVKDTQIEAIDGAGVTIFQGTPGSTELQYFTITEDEKTELRRLRVNGSIQVIRSGQAIDYGFALTANFFTGTTFFLDRRGLWSVLPNASAPTLVFESTFVRPEISARNIPFGTTNRGIMFLASTTNGVTYNVYHTDGIAGGGQTLAFALNQSYFDVPVSYDGLTYFVINNTTLSFQPWSTNGVTVERFATFPARVALLGKTGSHLYFSENSTIWAFSGNQKIEAAGAPASVSPLVVPPAADSEDRLYYIGRDDRGDELWVTDGTEAGAERLTDIQPTDETGAFAQLTAVDDVLFFAGKGENTGFELWRSEGTAGTTERLTDMRLGEDDSLPDMSEVSMMAALGDYAYFAADDGVHGMELWRVHKSGSPITLVQDLVPGAGSSDPHNFTVINGRLFFQAVDPSRKLIVLREVRDTGTDRGPLNGKTINVSANDSTLSLQFGQGIVGDYFLLESRDLMNWRPVQAYQGPSTQTVVRPLAESEQLYYRLQRN